MPSIKANRNQMFLLPPCIEGWVSANHLVRFIVEFVESLDLDKLGFKQELE